MVRRNQEACWLAGVVVSQEELRTDVAPVDTSIKPSQSSSASVSLPASQTSLNSSNNELNRSSSSTSDLNNNLVVAVVKLDSGGQTRARLSDVVLGEGDLSRVCICVYIDFLHFFKKFFFFLKHKT